jgi:hypothetical protein
MQIANSQTNKQNLIIGLTPFQDSTDPDVYPNPANRSLRGLSTLSTLEKRSLFHSSEKRRDLCLALSKS